MDRLIWLLSHKNLTRNEYLECTTIIESTLFSDEFNFQLLRTDIKICDETTSFKMAQNKINIDEEKINDQINCSKFLNKKDYKINKRTIKEHYSSKMHYNSNNNITSNDNIKICEILNYKQEDVPNDAEIQINTNLKKNEAEKCNLGDIKKQNNEYKLSETVTAKINDRKLKISEIAIQNILNNINVFLNSFLISRHKNLLSFIPTILRVFKIKNPDLLILNKIVDNLDNFKHLNNKYINKSIFIETSHCYYKMFYNTLNNTDPNNKKYNDTPNEITNEKNLYNKLFEQKIDINNLGSSQKLEKKMLLLESDRNKNKKNSFQYLHNQNFLQELLRKLLKLYINIGGSFYDDILKFFIFQSSDIQDFKLQKMPFNMYSIAILVYNYIEKPKLETIITKIPDNIIKYFIANYNITLCRLIVDLYFFYTKNVVKCIIEQDIIDIEMQKDHKKEDFSKKIFLENHYELNNQGFDIKNEEISKKTNFKLEDCKNLLVKHHNQQKTENNSKLANLQNININGQQKNDLPSKITEITKNDNYMEEKSIIKPDISNSIEVFQYFYGKILQIHHKDFMRLAYFNILTRFSENDIFVIQNLNRINKNILASDEIEELINLLLSLLNKQNFESLINGLKINSSKNFKKSKDRNDCEALKKLGKKSSKLRKNRVKNNSQVNVDNYKNDDHMENMQLKVENYKEYDNDHCKKEKKAINMWTLNLKETILEILIHLEYKKTHCVIQFLRNQKMFDDILKRQIPEYIKKNIYQRDLIKEIVTMYFWIMKYVKIDFIYLLNDDFLKNILIKKREMFFSNNYISHLTESVVNNTTTCEYELQKKYPNFKTDDSKNIDDESENIALNIEKAENINNKSIKHKFFEKESTYINNIFETKEALKIEKEIFIVKREFFEAFSKYFYTFFYKIHIKETKLPIRILCEQKIDRFKSKLLKHYIKKNVYLEFSEIKVIHIFVPNLIPKENKNYAGKINLSEILEFAIYNLNNKDVKCISDLLSIIIYILLSQLIIKSEHPSYSTNENIDCYITERNQNKNEQKSKKKHITPIICNRKNQNANIIFEKNQSNKFLNNDYKLATIKQINGDNKIKLKEYSENKNEIINRNRVYTISNDIISKEIIIILINKCYKLLKIENHIRKIGFILKLLGESPNISNKIYQKFIFGAIGNLRVKRQLFNENCEDDKIQNFLFNNNFNKKEVEESESETRYYKKDKLEGFALYKHDTGIFSQNSSINPIINHKNFVEETQITNEKYFINLYNFMQNLDKANKSLNLENISGYFLSINQLFNFMKIYISEILNNTLSSTTDKYFFDMDFVKYLRKNRYDYSNFDNNLYVLRGYIYQLQYTECDIIISHVNNFVKYIIESDFKRTEYQKYLFQKYNVFLYNLFKFERISIIFTAFIKYQEFIVSKNTSNFFKIISRLSNNFHASDAIDYTSKNDLESKNISCKFLEKKKKDLMIISSLRESYQDLCDKKYENYLMGFELTKNAYKLYSYAEKNNNENLTQVINKKIEQNNEKIDNILPIIDAEHNRDLKNILNTLAYVPREDINVDYSFKKDKKKLKLSIKKYNINNKAEETENFYNNTDITENKFNFYYCNNLSKKLSQKNGIPSPQSENDDFTCFEKLKYEVLKYLYNIQDFETIKSKIEYNLEKIAQIYTQKNVEHRTSTKNTIYAKEELAFIDVCKIILFKIKNKLPNTIIIENFPQLLQGNTKMSLKTEIFKLVRHATNNYIILPQLSVNYMLYFCLISQNLSPVSEIVNLHPECSMEMKYVSKIAQYIREKLYKNILKKSIITESAISLHKNNISNSIIGKSIEEFSFIKNSQILILNSIYSNLKLHKTRKYLRRIFKELVECEEIIGKWFILKNLQIMIHKDKKFICNSIEEIINEIAEEIKIQNLYRDLHNFLKTLGIILKHKNDFSYKCQIEKYLENIYEFIERLKKNRISCDVLVKDFNSFMQKILNYKILNNFVTAIEKNNPFLFESFLITSYLDFDDLLVTLESLMNK